MRCYSVPFFLGNQQKPSSIDDVTDPEILLPSRDRLSATPEETSDTRAPGSEFRTSEQRNHIITQGPWQTMSPVSPIKTLFSSNKSLVMRKYLRSGEYKLVCVQLYRIVKVRKILRGNICDRQMFGEISTSICQESVHFMAQSLSTRIRKSASFMTGPWNIPSLSRRHEVKIRATDLLPQPYGTSSSVKSPCVALSQSAPWNTKSRTLGS